MLNSSLIDSCAAVIIVPSISVVNVATRAIKVMVRFFHIDQLNGFSGSFGPSQPVSICGSLLSEHLRPGSELEIIVFFRGQCSYLSPTVSVLRTPPWIMEESEG